MTTYAVRLLAILLLGLTLMVLYIPSAHPPEFFYDLLGKEYALHIAQQGEHTGDDALAATLAMDPLLGAAVPLMPKGIPPLRGPSGESGRKLAETIGSALESEYARSFNAYYLLVGFRARCLATAIVPLLAFAVVACYDGWLRRRIKAETFSLHNPEIFSVAALLVVAMFGAAVVSVLCPVLLPPSLIVALLLGAGALLNRVIANYRA